ncbi:outer membrane assembly protein AsmA [Serratia sp. UGAL515B_01]|uniref:outer membrane assembly protein AsmA n=1 Tax=Serratia sp. UGAL515B_01 TaxID=2986763 RepID=UPI002953F63B|nr:outer membrane assembly protein AsmA [Serratia sp. UGAL515B_01]WON78131.1 outer membrane assembly protein AsmA [Serratia sp. UGAL515B_01]
MRRLLTTLAILLVVLVAGMAALVLLVNPNDFRAYMVKKVEQRSGYQLTLEDDLRWHVWPQLSVLAGRVTLTAPGAKAPVISADNMRLDVKLLPLLSHQLFVKQVMLKNAVIRLTADSEQQSQPEAPIAPGGHQVDDNSESLWKFDIDNLQVADSLLIWQRANNEQINVRDINFTLQSNGNHQAKMEFSSRVNRDQRDLTITLAADLDLLQYPRQINAKVTQFDYQLEGADIIAGGIKGEGSMQVVYQQSPNKIVFNPLMFSANGSQFTGSIDAQFGSIPFYTLDLTATQLNLDLLSGWHTDTSDEKTQSSPVAAAPVIANQDGDSQKSLKALREFDAQINLKADQVTYRAMNISQLRLKAKNQQGLLAVNTLAGKLAGGDFALPGSLDTRADKPVIKLQPVLQQIELGDVLKAFNIPTAMTGTFSMQGDLIGEQFTASSFEKNWHGMAQLTMQNAQLHGLNIQQLIQRAVARTTSGVSGQDNYQRYTEVKKMSAKARLHNGTLTLSDLAAESPFLSLAGGGTVDLLGRQCDVTLNVLVTGGWQGNNELIAQLSKMPIPLRVYGPWKQLNYQLQVEQLLRKALEDRAKAALNNWVEKNKSSSEERGLKKFLDRL